METGGSSTKYKKLVIAITYMYLFMLDEKLYGKEAFSALAVVALVLLVSDGILYYTVALDPGV